MGSRIDRIISDRVAEGEAWDFKRKLYDDTDKDTPEFLKDVTSFANAGGGTIVLGIETDEAGRASIALGVDCDSFDQEIQRLEHILRDCVEPDVTGAIKISDESNTAGQHFLVIDIEESPLGPHQIVRKGKFKSHFFVRRGRRSEEASVQSLRELFLGQQRVGRMFQEYVRERVSAVFGGQYLHAQEAIPQLLLHVAPRRAFGSRRLVDWMLQQENHFRLSPTASDGYRARPNIYGAINVSNEIMNPYNQAFYNGAVEMLRQAFTVSRTEVMSGIHAPSLADFFMDDLTRVLRVLHGVFSEDRYLVSANFLRVPSTELTVYRDGGFATRLANSIPAARDFEMPPMVIRATSGEVFEEDIKSLLDLVWRAWGQDHFNGQLNLRWKP